MDKNDGNHNEGGDTATKQQVLALLNQLGDRLKRAEAEREGLRDQIQAYRDQIEEIEDRAATTEKVYLNIENRLNAYDRSETELREELYDKVKKLEELEAKIPDTAILEQKLLDKVPDIAGLEEKLSAKIPDTTALEQKFTSLMPDTQALEKRVEAAEGEARQARENAENYANAADKLERRIEQLINDNTRMSRKLERLEDDVAKTDDALKSRAMVLLTDRQTADQSGQGYLPAGGAYARNISNDIGEEMAPFTKLMQDPLVRTASVVVLVLLGTGAGWLMNGAVQTGTIYRTGGVEQAAQTTQEVPGNTRRTAIAQMNTTPHKTARLGGAGDSAAASDQPQETERQHPRRDNQTGATQKNEAQEQKERKAKTQNKTTDQDAQAQQNVSRTASNEPAVHMNASKPGAGKSDRPQEQVVMPDKKLPDRLDSIYKQARGAEKAAEATLMAQKPPKDLDKQLNKDTDLPERFSGLQARAFKGDARARHDLAALYTAGRSGVQQDYERAITLFRASARQGIANARYNLGVLYHQGMGIERNMQAAIRYYRAASLLGHAQARYNLGIAHIQGVGTKYNPRYAAAYFEKAARDGVIEAAYNLGLIYENGLAGKANADLALFWYHHAAENGSKQAKTAMDQITKRLDLSEADIQQIISDTDLDVNITDKREKAGEQEAKKPDNESKAMNLPGDVQPAFTPSSDPDLIVQIQRQLSRFDLYSGNTDGDPGPKTRKAIKAYQDMHDLPQTGKSSEDLLVHMLSRSIEDSTRQQSAK